MKTLITFFTVIILGQPIMAQTKTFNGAWFDINYPSTFTAKGSLNSRAYDWLENAL
jgi:hypothetical protein